MMNKDRLCMLVPDGAYERVLPVLLRDRRESLGIAQVDFIPPIKDPNRDSSYEAASLIRPYLGSCTHFLMVRDLHGSGWEAKGADALKEKLTRDLHAIGCPPERSKVIIVEPEIEIWLRIGSTHVKQLVRQRARAHGTEVDMLFDELVQEKLLANGGINTLGKPIDPKKVFEEVLKHYRIIRSNVLYEELAKTESLRHCRVPSFLDLVNTLQTWFPTP